MLPCKDAFASALEQLAQSLDPHESECHKRLEVIETLNKTLSSAFPPPSKVVARPYGSFISGFFTATSDLDIALQGKVARSLLPHKDALDPAVLIDHGDNGQTISMVKLDYRERQAVLEHTAKAVQECASNSLNSVDWRALTARIPLVRMTEVHNNLQVDVCCGSAGSAFKSNVISHISSTEPRVKQLFHLVQLWARFYGLNDGASNTFNSWSLTLMVLFALQQTSPPILPPMWQCFMGEHEPGHMPMSTASNTGDVGAASSDSRRIGSHLQAGNKSSPDPLGARLLMGEETYNDDDSMVSEELECALQQCMQWAGKYAQRSAHSLLDCLQHFLTLWSEIMDGWDAGHYRSHRVSVWMGQFFDCAFKAPYRCLIEDPFDYEDNTARTLGSATHPTSKLPYVARVLRMSSKIVAEALAGKRDLQEAFIGLFGPHSMPIYLSLACQPAPLDAVLTMPPRGGSNRVNSNKADTWRTAAVLYGHARWVSSVAFTPDGQFLVSASHDNTIRVCDLTTYPIYDWAMKERHDNRVNSVAVSPDSKTVVSGSMDRTVRLWSLDDGQCMRIASQPACVTCVAFSPSGHEVACGALDHVSILSMNTLDLKTSDGSKYVGINVQCVAYTPDGTKLVAAGSNLEALHSPAAIRVFDLLCGGPPMLLQGHRDGIQKVAVTPDSSSVISCSWDKTLRFWDLTSGECLRTFPPQFPSIEAHRSKVVGLAVTPDGEQAISGSVDKTVRVWKIKTGRLQATLTGHEDGVWTVAASPNGKLMASGSNDNTIRLWELCHAE